MNVAIEEPWQGFVERIVKDGRYGSVDEVVREGLRLVEERETKIEALRAALRASVDAGGYVTEDEIDTALAQRSGELRRRGLGA